MKLKLKDGYKGAIITLNHNKFGKITLDTNNIDESEYEFYYNAGFQSMFTKIKHKVIKYKGI